MSAADASGSMPPKSANWAFFTITGTPEGGRANLAPDNAFLLGVTTKEMENRFDVPVLPKEPYKIVFPVVPQESLLEQRVRKLDEDIDRRLAKLVSDMEAVLHRIESDEARAREAELKKQQELEALKQKVLSEKTVVEKGIVPAEAKTVESATDRDIGSDVMPSNVEIEKEVSVPEAELSFWDFAQFPHNLLVPVMYLKFW